MGCPALVLVVPQKGGPGPCHPLREEQGLVLPQEDAKGRHGTCREGGSYGDLRPREGSLWWEELPSPPASPLEPAWWQEQAIRPRE